MDDRPPAPRTALIREMERRRRGVKMLAILRLRRIWREKIRKRGAQNKEQYHPCPGDEATMTLPTAETQPPCLQSPSSTTSAINFGVIV
jgi:hypothetical protein